MSVAVGIDLGTTNSVVAVVRDGSVMTLPDPAGARLVPSVVSFHPSGTTLVGTAAVERRLNDPANTIYSVKRLIGRTWDSPEVQQARVRLPFELQAGPNGSTLVVARGESYSLPEVSAFVLRQVRAIAEKDLGQAVDRAVITVPANFNDLQRAATKSAGRLAGIEVLRILNEPTAAALAYGASSNQTERVAVYDFGGGTFDVTILDLAGDVFEVLATAGDTALGGDDIDVVVAERMADDLLKKHRYDARAHPAIFTRLRLLAEKMKQALSSKDDHVISVDDFAFGDRGATVQWQFRMTRPELEWASLSLVDRTFKVCQKAIDASGGLKAIDRVILVGGATRMPMVARKVEQFFGRPPMSRINPEEVVALGAAIAAAQLDGRSVGAGQVVVPAVAASSLVSEATPYLPDESIQDVVLPVVGGKAASAPIRQPPPRPRSKAAPAEQFLPGRLSKPLVFQGAEEPAAGNTSDTASVVPVRSPARTLAGIQAPDMPAPPPLAPMRPRQATAIYPFEIADVGSDPAVGAQPAPRRSPLLIDVTPLSLGVETAGGFCDILIEANTPVPCDRTRTFVTAADGQTRVQVRISQGQSRRFDENTCLGQLELDGITAGPRGSQQVAVTFEIDADGILNVRARELSTGRETAARMQLAGDSGEAADMEAMAAKQEAHPLAPLEGFR